MKTIAFPLIFISFAGLMTACSLFSAEDLLTPLVPAVVPQETINIGNNRISCDYCREFGNRIEIIGDEILIGGNGTVRIFKYQSGNITLKQTIDYGTRTSRIETIAGHDNKLVIGFNDNVYIYEKQPNEWTLKQTITPSVSGDNFGSAIDFDDQWMVIGANAPWMDANFVNNKSGRAYIYSLDHGTWLLHKTLEPQTLLAGGRFGETVALYKNSITVGRSFGPNQNYELIHNTWTLVDGDLFQWSKIVHDKDYYLSVSAYGSKYFAWRLSDDGTKNYLTGSVDFLNLSSPHIGEDCEIKGDLFLVTSRNVFQSFLFKRNNSDLILQETFNQNTGEQIQFQGLAIGDHFIALGGYNNSSRNGKDVNIVVIKPR